jgi:putative ABC transport system permease protein
MSRMFGYSVELALHGLRRFPKTTALVVLTVAIGLAASMTTLALLHMLSADPLPGRSQHLFLAWVDTVQAKPQTYTSLDGEATLDYKRMKMPDVQALMAAHHATRQAAVANMDTGIEGDGGRRSESEEILGTTSDFVPMFGVALLDGRGWTPQEDASHAPVAVIDSHLADVLFGTTRAVGQVMHIKDHAIRVIGVSERYAPQPHFYGLGSWTFGGDNHESVFMPYTTALDTGMLPEGSDGCDDSTDKNKTMLHVDPVHCSWLEYWVQLDTPQDVTAYRAYLDNFAQEQNSLAGFGKKPASQLTGVGQWLTLQNVIPDNVRLNVWLAISFLLLCMANVAGLLAAKFMRRSAEIGIRRALGAPRRAVIAQHLLEASAVCILGGVLAWPLTLLGLALLRMQDQGFTDLAHLDMTMFGALFALALVVGVVVGWLPSWRIAMVQPGLQVKSA